ncbi:MAG: tetratricopeptide repeat protein, partial [Dehalococcoidia bacterium]
EVAQRLGLACDGIGYPGHFIVRCGDPDDPIYVDPFNQGVRLDRAELLAGLRDRELGSANPEVFLAAVTRRQILQRMLNNLYAVYRDRVDAASQLLNVVEFMVRLEPWNAALVGERGLLHYRLGNMEGAFRDLQSYMESDDARSVPTAARLALAELRIKFAHNEDQP